MQQPVSYTPYIAVFPPLPVSASSVDNLDVKITQIFHVSLDKSKFSEEESIRVCQAIMRETETHIEMYESKNPFFAFLLNGNQHTVHLARHRILAAFQNETSKQISILKKLHYVILAEERFREIEKNTGTKISFPDLDVRSNVVTIIGTKEGVEEAEYELKKIADVNNPGNAFERTNVPKIYHPFVCGPHNKNLSAIVAKTGASINFPPSFVQSDEITITGKKEAVAAAKKSIVKIYADMKMRCKSMTVKLPKLQHKYIIGHRNSAIAEILEVTGVSVEVPSLDLETETIILRGPRKGLIQAVEKVNEKAKHGELTPFVKAPAWLHKYIIGHEGVDVRRMMEDVPKVVVEFTAGEAKIKIEGPPKDVKRAQKELNAVIRQLYYKLTFLRLRIDTIFFKYVARKCRAIVNRLKDAPGIIIHLLENERSNEISFEGNQAGIEEVQIELDECQQQLMNLLKASYDVNFHVLELPVLEHFYEFVVGRGRADIRKMCGETRTMIDLPAEGENRDAITIFGKKEKVEEVKNKFLKIQEDLKKIAAEEICILPKFHNSLIGTNGKLIRSIVECCGGVKITVSPPNCESPKVSISGSKYDVENAKQQLIEAATDKPTISSERPKPKKCHKSTVVTKHPKTKKNDCIEDVISIDPKYHKIFLEYDRMIFDIISGIYEGVAISFPCPGVRRDRISLKGPREDVKAVKDFMRQIVEDLKNIFGEDEEEEEEYLEDLEDLEDLELEEYGNEARALSCNPLRRAVITAPRLQWGRKRRKPQSFIYY